MATGSSAEAAESGYAASMSNDFTVLDPAPYTDFLRRALDEDHATRDVTSHTLIPNDGRRVRAELLCKEDGVLAGLTLVEPCFQILDKDAHVDLKAYDGDRVGAKSTVAWVEAEARALLAGERTALNIVRHLSGVATLTATFCEHTMATGTKIHDTRKTTPGWRTLEKYAVRCGGGHNHRLNLEVGAMVKENHLVGAYGSTGPDAIARAVKALREELDDNTSLCVEVENQRELEAVLEAAKPLNSALVIMLDDFELGDIRRAVKTVRALPAPRPQLEVTGGVNLKHVEALAATGINRISIGALTHSAPSLDLSLKIRSVNAR